MTTLQGSTPATTFKDLLQVSNSGNGVDSTVRAVSSGAGTSTPLQLSDTKVNIQSGFQLAGSDVSANVLSLLAAASFAAIANLLNPTIATKTADYTATATDSIILADATSGNVVITLPTAVGRAGKVYTIKKIDAASNTVSIHTTGAQNIDGGVSADIYIMYVSITVISDGANWWIL